MIQITKQQSKIEYPHNQPDFLKIRIFFIASILKPL